MYDTTDGPINRLFSTDKANYLQVVYPVRSGRFENDAGLHLCLS